MLVCAIIKPTNTIFFSLLDYFDETELVDFLEKKENNQEEDTSENEIEKEKEENDEAKFLIALTYSFSFSQQRVFEDKQLFFTSLVQDTLLPPPDFC